MLGHLLWLVKTQQRNQLKRRLSRLKTPRYALAALLAEDATFAIPPFARWWRGREVIAAFAAQPVHRYLPARANAQPANASYRWDPEKGRYAAEALEVLTLDGMQVKVMTAFMTPHVFPRFGLPEMLS